MRFPGPTCRAPNKGTGMRVLQIEDDCSTAQSIELTLKSESFSVYTTGLGAEGVDLGKLYDYDLILLDLNLPDMSGYEVLRTLRVSKVKTPILILSGFAGVEDKVRGLGFGADDYMTKPFHKDELVARIHAIVRRSKGHAQSVIQTGDLVVNLDTKTVEVQQGRVHLTGKEYQLLELLSLRKGTTLTKEMFLNHLYGGMDEPGLKIIDVFICKLRKKLANASNGNNYIETLWGRGYALRKPMMRPNLFRHHGAPSSVGDGDRRPRDLRSGASSAPSEPGALALAASSIPVCARRCDVRESIEERARRGNGRIYA
jgi:two-component system, cell cycle response regulator CtrA